MVFFVFFDVIKHLLWRARKEGYPVAIAPVAKHELTHVPVALFPFKVSGMYCHSSNAMSFPIV
ncbi:MAG: hypothetical protein WA667_20090 [Candidatus Nitrosopolaris sp.]